MRVLMVADVAWPDEGALPRHVGALARALRGRGHVAAVAVPSSGAEATVQVDPWGTVVHRLPGWHRHLGATTGLGRAIVAPAPDRGFVAALARLIVAGQPDVVHAHGRVVASCGRAAGATGVPMAVTLHDHRSACLARDEVAGRRSVCGDPSRRACPGCARQHLGLVEGRLASAAARVDRRSLRRADGVLAVSRQLAGEARAAGAHATRVAHVPGFIDLAEVAAAGTDRPDFLPEGSFALCVGADRRSTDREVVLQAWRAHRPGLPLVIADGRPDAAPVDGVLELGPLDGADVLRAWHHAEVGIVASRAPEPCPMSVLEALATGTPLVASRLGGIPDQVGDAAVLVRPGDAAGLAAAVAALHRDPATRTSLAAAGHQRVEGFAVEAVARQVEAAYRCLLHTRTP